MERKEPVVVRDYALSLKTQLYLDPGSANKFYQNLWPKVRDVLAEGSDWVEVFRRYKIPLYTRLSRGNQRPPYTRNQLISRLAGILRRATQNPLGIKSLSKIYSRKNKGRSVKPAKVSQGGGSHLRRGVRLMVDKGLLFRTPKGVCTSEKGKELLRQALKDIS